MAGASTEYRERPLSAISSFRVCNMPSVREVLESLKPKPKRQSPRVSKKPAAQTSGSQSSHTAPVPSHIAPGPGSKRVLADAPSSDPIVIVDAAQARRRLRGKTGAWTQVAVASVRGRHRTTHRSHGTRRSRSDRAPSKHVVASTAKAAKAEARAKRRCETRRAQKAKAKTMISCKGRHERVLHVAAAKAKAQVLRINPDLI